MRWLKDQRGSVTVWLMMLPLLLLTIAGITTDLWAALSTRGLITAIADDAAAAGATAVDIGHWRTDGRLRLVPDAAAAAARQAVVRHPDAAMLHDVQVNATDEAVQVQVEGIHDFALLPLVGADHAVVRATARAAPIMSDGS